MPFVSEPTVYTATYPPSLLNKFMLVLSTGNTPLVHENQQDKSPEISD